MLDINVLLVLLFFYGLLNDSGYKRYGLIDERKLIRIGFRREV